MGNGFNCYPGGEHAQILVIYGSTWASGQGTKNPRLDEAMIVCYSRDEVAGTHGVFCINVVVSELESIMSVETSISS